MSISETATTGTLLLADDSSLDRNLLAQILMRRGYRVVATANATEALKQVGHVNPDLILLDIRMPDMSGYELCAKLKTDPGTKDIPVIFISAATSEKERVQAFSSGGVDYISKPIMSEEVHSRISTHLALRNLRLNLEQRVSERTAELEASNRRLIAEVAERRRMEDDLRERNHLINCLIDANILGIIFWRADGTIIDANEAALQLLERHREEILAGQVSWDQLVAAEDRKTIAHIRTELDRSAGHFPSYEINCLLPDGGSIPVLIGSARMDGNEDVGISFIFDISGQKDLQHELLQSQQQLRNLAAHGEAAMEQERKRIAREIHDEQGSLLTALKLDITLLCRELGDRSSSLHPRIASIQHLVEETIRVMRRVATELRPEVLNFGILPALEWLVEDFRKRTGTGCRLITSADIPLDEQRATAVFRIVQESMTNVTRHAQASHLDIRLNLGNNGLNLCITDNGQGFDPTSVSCHSYGLMGMRERAETLGGQLVIESGRGLGTTLHIEIPLEQAES